MSSAPDKFTFSANVFKYWVLDHRAGELRIYFQDGRVLTEPTMQTVSDVLATSCFDWENWSMISQTRRSDIIFSEVFSPVSSDKGRPSIYLDQNHWSTVAWSRVEPNRVRDLAELTAAQRLIELAEDAGVVLPLSSCHLNEISPLFGNRRYDLGVAMARLLGGWLLRHPIAVLAEEAYGIAMAATRGEEPENHAPVVTLEPYACFPAPVGQLRTALRSDFELLRDAMACPSVLLDQLIEDKPHVKVDMHTWVKGNQQLTDQFASMKLKASDSEKLLVTLFWHQHIEILAEAMRAAKQDPDVLTALLLEGSLRPGEGHPFTSLYFALFKRRIQDKSTRWKANDLNDMAYLSCAAAHAEYLVAEKHTGTQLRQISESQSQGRNIFTNLSDLVEKLDQDGVETASERAGKSK